MKRHEDSLNNLIELVALEGIAEVPKACLTLWYKQERFTVSIRNDLRTRFEDLTSSISWLKDKTLRFGELNNKILLIRSDVLLEDDN